MLRVKFLKWNLYTFEVLVYQLVLSHGLIKINIGMRSIIIIIYLSLFSSIKYSNTYSKIYIHHYLVTINFILHHTSISPYVFDIYLVELFVCKLVFLSLLSYLNTWWHISLVVFYINNILIMIETTNLEIYIDAL